jgi:hypothetical protein
MATATSDREKPENCATAWFAALERARIAGNARLESRAISELLRLGVHVTFGPSQFSEEDESK